MQTITIDDYGQIVEPGEASFSPDGRQIAFMLGGEAYVMPVDGSTAPLKLSKAGYGYAKVRPVWSLDGTQLFLLYHDKKKQTSEIYAASVDNSATWSKWAQVTTEAWAPNLSPGQTHWLLSANERPKKSSDKVQPPECAPIVVDAMVMKQDGKGYVTADANNRIYSWDVAAKRARRLTSKDGHDTQPAWSPDGSKVAFIREDVSKPEYQSDLCIISSSGDKGRRPDSRTSSKADRRSPTWSPDGKQVAYLWRDSKLGPYAVTRIAVFSPATDQETILTERHDRTITSFRFSEDGRFIYFLFDNEGGSHLARIHLSNNRVQNLVAGERYVASFDLNADGRVVLNMKTMNDATDIYVMKDRPPRRLTNLNSSYFESRRRGAKEQFFYQSKSGQRIQALVTKPADFDPSKRYPTVLRIHGGPVQQAKFGFDFFSQFLAASGYVVVEPNPPGSTGRGQDFIANVKGDWGFKKDPDVLGAIDEAVKLGYADPKNLAVIGYSYGGYMTNCLITMAPKKFKAAVSGAGHSFIAANYGHDIYLKWYNWGLGHPWIPKNRKKYEKLSPLNDAEKVKTPTLFLCGAQDWNVPILNAELFYQALRVRGVRTQLVVYPKAAHTTHWDDGESDNSKDYYRRVLGWLDEFLKS